MAEILKIEPRHKGWASFFVAQVQLPNGQVVTREIEDHGRAVSVLPYDPVRRTAIVIRQFRPPVLYAGGDPMLIEVVSGLAEGDDPLACVRREAMEEAGLRIGEIEFVMRCWTMPGISTERSDLYLSVYSPEDRVAEGGGIAEEHEHVEVIELPLGTLAEMADTGALHDMKTLVLVQTLRVRRPDLF